MAGLDVSFTETSVFVVVVVGNCLATDGRTVKLNRTLENGIYAVLLEIYNHVSLVSYFVYNGRLITVGMRLLAFSLGSIIGQRCKIFTCRGPHLKSITKMRDCHCEWKVPESTSAATYYEMRCAGPFGRPPVV